MLYQFDSLLTGNVNTLHTYTPQLNSTVTCTTQLHYIVTPQNYNTQLHYTDTLHSYTTQKHTWFHYTVTPHNNTTKLH